MGFLRKETGVDILDLTLLQKKGLLRIPESRFADVVDLTMPPQVPPSLPQPTPLGPISPTPVADNPFGMLDNLTNSSLNSSIQTNAESAVDSTTFNALRLKLDDVEYKLERLVEKFSLLDERLAKAGQA